jgi:hypothetical protein
LLHGVEAVGLFDLATELTAIRYLSACRVSDDPKHYKVPFLPCGSKACKSGRMSSRLMPPLLVETPLTAASAAHWVGMQSPACFGSEAIADISQDAGEISFGLATKTAPFPAPKGCAGNSVADSNCATELC